jgi:2-polyprenyl-6-methoxyphenol hydroxylase-like FAD-dependent oxidoreductase
LYTNLEKKETKIKTSAEVVDIKSHANGVDVHLKDGSIVKGSIVIGADGVHSKTRALMQSLAKVQDPSVTENGDDYPMISSFHGIFARASNDDLRIEKAVLFESRGAGAVIQCTATEDIVHFVTLKPLPEPTTARTRYTAQDMEDYAASIADVAVCPGVKFRDLWAKVDKSSARKLNQEEGFLKRWHHSRIVLVGDAVHKSTSVNGLGLTCGLHSAAVLANELQKLFASHQSQLLATDLLDETFSRYQSLREREAKQIWDNGHSMIREVTRKSWVSWFWDNYVLPWFDMEKTARGILVSWLLIRNGQTLSYVPFEGKHGIVPWRRRANVQGV